MQPSSFNFTLHFHRHLNRSPFDFTSNASHFTGRSRRPKEDSAHGGIFCAHSMLQSVDRSVYFIDAQVALEANVRSHQHIARTHLHRKEAAHVLDLRIAGDDLTQTLEMAAIHAFAHQQTARLPRQHDSSADQNETY